MDQNCTRCAHVKSAHGRTRTTDAGREFRPCMARGCDCCGYDTEPSFQCGEH